VRENLISSPARPPNFPHHIRIYIHQSVRSIEPLTHINSPITIIIIVLKLAIAVVVVVCHCCLFVLFGTTYWVNPNMLFAYPKLLTPHPPVSLQPEKPSISMYLYLNNAPSSRQAKCQPIGAGSGVVLETETECKSGSEPIGGPGCPALPHIRRLGGLAPPRVLRWQSQRRVKVPSPAFRQRSPPSR